MILFVLIATLGTWNSLLAVARASLAFAAGLGVATYAVASVDRRSSFPKGSQHGRQTAIPGWSLWEELLRCLTGKDEP